MRTYGQYCPIARTSELIAERWTPIIVRNLFYGCRTFTEIRQGAPGISTALLASRRAAAGAPVEDLCLATRNREPGMATQAVEFAAAAVGPIGPTSKPLPAMSDLNRGTGVPAASLDEDNPLQ